jgi:hypothetical protein
MAARYRLVSFDGGVAEFAEDEAGPWVSVVDYLKTEASLRAELAAARRCLAFFASVIKSGEPWTATCQAEYDAAVASQQSAQVGEQGKEG